MTLQEKMMWYRAKEKITQKELAERCGLSHMTINQIENGAIKPRKITEMKILWVVGGRDENINQ